MLPREAIVLAKFIIHEPRRLRVSHGRSITAATKSSKTWTKQNWRKTRKKIGPSTSKAVVDDAIKDLEDDLRNEISSNATTFATTTKLIGDVEQRTGQYWVPMAYRGVVDDTKPRNSIQKHRLKTLQAKQTVRPRRVDKPVTERYVLRSKDGVVDVPVIGLPRLAVVAKQRKEESIMNDISAFKLAAASYRTHFCVDDNSTLNDQNEPIVSPSSKSFQEQIASEIQSLHDNLETNSKRINDSLRDFISLRQLLQQICSTACHLSTLRKYNDQDANVYIDLAEFTLLGLVQINHDRLLLLENEKHKTDHPGKSPGDEVQSKSQSVVTGWFNQFVEGLTPSSLAAKSTEKKAEPEPDENVKFENYAIATSMLQSIKRLLRNVVTIIASTTKEPEIPLVANVEQSTGNTKENTSGRTIDEKVGQRMITLLEKTWSLRVSDDEATHHVMEVLARTGTLESARLCYDVYKKHYIYADRQIRHISVAAVLEAYLEAIKRESDQVKVHDIVEEVMNIHNAAPWVAHRVERIINASIVLSCLAAANMGKVDGMCGRAELVAKRAFNKEPFIAFVEQVESDNPRVDNVLVPIANYLAHLYATSGQSQLVETSKKLLKYAMNDDDGFNAMTNYPTADTCNAVLQALVQEASEKESTSKQSDYVFARQILKFMFSKTEMGCCPSQTTYDCLFMLLEATHMSDIGIYGEELLSYIETNNLLYVSSTFCLPRRTYHRVLQYYLKMAKDSTPSTTIDETKLPYRRAAHLLRKLEIRSTPLVLSYFVLDKIAVENLYLSQLRPQVADYELVMQICAHTSQRQYQDEAADVAIEIYRTNMIHTPGKEIADDWDAVLQNCTNTSLVKRVSELTTQMS